MIELDVSRIKNISGGKERLIMDAVMEPLDIGAETVIFNSPVRLDVTLYNDGKSIDLSGMLEGDVRLVCSRCLEYYDLPVRTEIEETYYNEARGDIEPGEEWTAFRGDRLDITAGVEKAVISALPMKPVCREECRGLCQKCGANLNVSDCGCERDEIDIRLEKLKQLIARKD
ncbi:MAG: YceD family protein [Bacillota bacterium]